MSSGASSPIDKRMVVSSTSICLRWRSLKLPKMSRWGWSHESSRACPTCRRKRQPSPRHCQTRRRRSDKPAYSVPRKRRAAGRGCLLQVSVSSLLFVLLKLRAKIHLLLYICKYFGLFSTEYTTNRVYRILYLCDAKCHFWGIVALIKKP